MSRVEWDYFDKFEYVEALYLPKNGEGTFKHHQIVTAVCKLIYKWYNDGDVFDNVHSNLHGWANDLSSYANWLYANTDSEVADILMSIYDMNCDEEYEHLLKALADTCLDLEYLHKYAGILRTKECGSIYDCDGPFEFTEHPGYPDTVGIDYESWNHEFIITDEDGTELEGGFETLSDAIRFCEEKGLDYDTSYEAEERDELPYYARIEWDEDREKFVVINDNTDDIAEEFDELPDAEEWCDDNDVPYDIDYKASNIWEKIVEEKEDEV